MNHSITRFGIAAIGSLGLLTSVSLVSAQTDAGSCREVSGFRGATWECQDGTTGKLAVTNACYSSEMYQKKAEEACRGACNKENGKCGVNSFAVGEECTTKQCSTSSTTSTCPNLDQAALRCKEAGQTPERYKGDDGCYQVRCVAPQTNTTPTCNPTNEEVKMKATKCERELGGRPVLKFENGCYTFIECAKRENTINAKTPGSTCSPTNDEVKARAMECEKSGKKPVMKKSENGCYTMTDCVERTGNEKPATNATEAVACKRTMEGNFWVFSCEDGVQVKINRNAQGEGKPMTTPPTERKPEKPKPPVTSAKGPCADAEKAMKDAYLALQKNKADATLKQTFTDAQTKLTECRKANVPKK